MLYAIKNGFNVERQNQQNIIYLISSFKRVQELGLNYIFSDGHGFAAITGWYYRVQDFKEVDWNIVYANRWNDTEEDTDRKRRKQAEFLVEYEVPIHAVNKIITYNQNALNFVNSLLRNFPNISYISSEIK